MNLGIKLKSYISEHSHYYKNKKNLGIQKKFLKVFKDTLFKLNLVDNSRHLHDKFDSLLIMHFRFIFVRLNIFDLNSTTDS